jgi:hypothetical protein
MVIIDPVYVQGRKEDQQDPDDRKRGGPPEGLDATTASHERTARVPQT